MTAEEAIDRLGKARVIPVLRAQSLERAREAALWLREAGFGVIEMTLTTPGALELVEEAAGWEGMTVGCGTVLSAQDASAAIAAGAHFIVTPCWADGVIERCREAGAASLIGAATPGEILKAHAAGADAVKLFPAASIGGPDFIRHVRAVFADVRMVPTGGIREDEIAIYLAAGAFAVGMGSELVRGSREEVVARGRRILAGAEARSA